MLWPVCGLRDGLKCLHFRFQCHLFKFNVTCVRTHQSKRTASCSYKQRQSFYQFVTFWACGHGLVVACALTNPNPLCSACPTIRFMSESYDVAPTIAGVIFTRFPLGFLQCEVYNPTPNKGNTLEYGVKPNQKKQIIVTFVSFSWQCCSGM